MFSKFINVINSDSTLFALEEYFELTNIDSISSQLKLRDSSFSKSFEYDVKFLKKKIQPLVKHSDKPLYYQNEFTLDSVRMESVYLRYGFYFTKEYLFCSNKNGRLEILVNSISRNTITDHVIYNISMINIIPSKLKLNLCDCIKYSYQNERADNIDAIYQIKSERQIEDSLLYSICRKYSYWQTPRSFQKKVNIKKCELGIDPSTKNPKLIDSLFLNISDLDQNIIKRKKALLYPGSLSINHKVSIGKYKEKDPALLLTEINLEQGEIIPPIDITERVKFDSIIKIGSFDSETTIVLSLELLNKGDNPLIIVDVISDCGCKVKMEDRFKNIEPHKKKIIIIEIESNGKTGVFEKEILLFTNSLKLETTVLIQGVFE